MHPRQRCFFKTPSPVAAFLCTWAIRGRTDRVLEPCAGRGALIRAAEARFRLLGCAQPPQQIVAVEKDKELAAALGSYSGAKRIAGDFLDLSPAAVGEVDAVVANPPFVRLRYLPRKRQKELACRFPEVSRRASVWAYFLRHARNFLGKNGRIAFVLPWQLVTTDYGRQALAAAAKNFASVEVLFLRWNVFEAAQVRTLLLLCEGAGPCPGIRPLNFRKPEGLSAGLTHSRQAIPRPAAIRSAYPSTGLHIEVRLLGLARELGFVALSQVARIRIGTVTGADSYFLLTEAEAQKWKIPDCCLSPILAGPRQFSGLRVRRADWKRLRSGGAMCHVLRPCDEHRTSPSPMLRRYLAHGQVLGIDKRYKCRMRPSWFSVPLAPPPDMFLTYMSYQMPRIVVNRGRLVATNRIHHLSLIHRPELSGLQRFASVFLNYLTLATAEIAGRPYGGGVLKLEPSDCARVMVPGVSDARLAGVGRAVINRLDVMLRRDHGPMWGNFRRVQDTVSNALAKAYGVSERDRVWIESAYRGLHRARIRH